MATENGTAGPAQAGMPVDTFTCPDCGGSGANPASSARCERCAGTGRLPRATHEIHHVFIEDPGDPSVGLFPQQATISFPGGLFTENFEGGTEELRAALKGTFTNLVFGEPVRVTFDFEQPCPECGGPPGCTCEADNRQRKAELVAEGHTDHCASRIMFGDGECECGKTGPARFDATGKADPSGVLVPFADYDAVKASLNTLWFDLRASRKERDEAMVKAIIMARKVLKEGRGCGWICCGCGCAFMDGEPHATGCIIGEAEKLVAEQEKRNGN